MKQELRVKLVRRFYARFMVSVKIAYYSGPSLIQTPSIQNPTTLNFVSVYCGSTIFHCHLVFMGRGKSGSETI